MAPTEHRAPGVQHAIQRLLWRELRFEGSADIVATARSVSDRLTRYLATFMGEAGARALYERSLELTKRRDPLVAAALSEPAQAQLDPVSAEQATLASLMLYVELLETFIGENLVIRVLNDVAAEDG